MNRANVRYVMMGVWGINYYARSGATLFTTIDRDLFLPPDVENLVRAWDVCEAQGLDLWAGREPLDIPRDELIAKRIVEFRALTTATGRDGLHIDLSMVMADFTFDDIWTRRRTFTVDGVAVPVASLSDIVDSKAKAGRPKDKLFLATHEEALKHLLREQDQHE
jgi:hypothetical protein